MKIRNDALQGLLHKTKRTQVIDGKTQDQVYSCVLRVVGNSVSTTSLTKDGVSSVSKFNAELLQEAEEEVIYIPDISILLGALKYHGQEVTLKQDVDKLRLKSSKKQTTLMASPDALAYPHTPKSMKEWEMQALEVAKKIERWDSMEKWSYTDARDGNQWNSTKKFKIDSTDLFEALRCDSMNGQKVNRYRFFIEDETLFVETGGEQKGKTTTALYSPVFRTLNYELDVVVQGGLEQLFSKINGHVYLCWFDFKSAGQGVKLLFQLGDETSFVLQSGLLR
tara:strand:- start:2853 stop:3692 length:840 start_codon:yes stop_codon:yes gene_type:complete